MPKTRSKTLPCLQKKLGYTGSDDAFKKCVLDSLEKRGPIYSKVFKMYYGIDCPKRTSEQIAKEFGICTVYNITRLVMKLVEKDVNTMMEEIK